MWCYLEGHPSSASEYKPSRSFYRGCRRQKGTVEFPVSYLVSNPDSQNLRRVSIASLSLQDDRPQNLCTPCMIVIYVKYLIQAGDKRAGSLPCTSQGAPHSRFCSCWWECLCVCPGKRTWELEGPQPPGSFAHRRISICRKGSCLRSEEPRVPGRRRM